MADTWDGKERRHSARFARWRSARPPLAAVMPYVAICGVVIFGFFVQGSNSSRIEREAKQRDHAICEDGNERAASMRAYTSALGVEVPGIPPDIAERLAALAAREFAPKECPPAP